MQILFVSSEVFPYSKTGGLADVVGALPQALAEQGHEVLVISPWYRTLKAAPAPLWIGDVKIPFEGGFSSVGVGEQQQQGVRHAFIGHADYDRDTLYGFSDDTKRFARFCRAVPQVSARVHFQPDIIHINDWQTGYLPVLMQRGWHLPEWMPFTPTVFTIHNAQYQGQANLDEVLYWLRLSPELHHSSLNASGHANAMQAACGFANHVTTVSPSYAQEIQTAQYGYGLDGFFTHINHKLSGILNGLDTTQWNPDTDPHIPQTFNATQLKGKQACKEALKERFHLEGDGPIIGVVSRLADQKGIDIFIAALPRLIHQGWNIVVLGSGDPALETTLRAAQAHFPGRIGALIGYDESLAHHIYAGGDALAIPSRFEPCGLTQMIAMRYGTLPIARATGGLRDTITHGETGFLFEHITSDGLLWATSEAMKAWKTPQWTQMMVAGMRQDMSWDASAKTYTDLYESVLAANRS